MEYWEKAGAMIYGRRSVRRYAETVDMEALRKAVDTAWEGAAPLAGIAKPTVKLLEGQSAQSVFSGIVGHYGKVVAPAYIVVSAPPGEQNLVASGYVVEQMVLWLAGEGYGTCWIGIPVNTGRILEMSPLPPGVVYVILLAVGKPAEGTPLMRSVQGYQRKAMGEIVAGDIPPGWESILEAGRLAPSASNGQPWRFVCLPGGIDVYCQGPGPLKKMFYAHLNRIDCGIALSHLDLAAGMAGFASAAALHAQGPAALFEKGKREGQMAPIARLRIEKKS